MRFALPNRSFIVPVLSVAALLVAATASAESPIAWQNDLQSAHAAASSTNRPLLLHFRSDNCVWCDRLEAGAFQSPDVAAAINQNFVPVTVHAGQSPELAKMFQVTKFPTDVIVMPSGQTLSHRVSPQDPDKYVAMLTTGLQARTPATVPAPMATPPQMANSPQTAIASAPAAPVQTAMAPPVSSPAQPAVANNRGTTTNPYATVAGPVAGGATAQLAGAKTDAMTLGMPAQMQTPVSSETTTANTSGTPKLAMEGFCSVTVIDDGQWAEGNPKFGVIHLGKLYLFASEENMSKFLADPTPYTPVLNEIDVIRFFEEKRIVPGKRQFGVQDPLHGRMFFFADEAAMNHFDKEYQRYVDAAIEVMEKAVKEANPNAS